MEANATTDQVTFSVTFLGEGQTMKLFSKIALSIAMWVGACVTPAAAATTVGSIYACYACQNTGNQLVDAALAANPDVASDGLLFAFFNTSGSAITGATFNLSAGSYTDSFTLPTLAANSGYIYIPGKGNDGKSHPVGSLFATTGLTQDTSDGDGSVSDGSVFSFTGSQGLLAVTSGNFTAGDAALIKPFRDNPANGSTSFLGFGPSGDGGCSNCYYGQIATLSVASPVSSIPEPASWGLMLAGFGLAGLNMRKTMRNRSTLPGHGVVFAPFSLKVARTPFIGG